MAIAGGVAYVGDRVGHQVGRKRLTLFDIRPRYTSTIVAIGTGMIIALVVTLVAIFASQEVKTAFFKLSSINAQIADLQSRQSELDDEGQERPLGGRGRDADGSLCEDHQEELSAAERLATIQDYYSSAVRYVNNTYPALGLKPYMNPPDIDKQLSRLANSVDASAKYPGDVMLSVTSDQNLFEGDQIHFGISGTPDSKNVLEGRADLRPTGYRRRKWSERKTSRSANCSAAFPRSLCSGTYRRFLPTAYKR